MFENIIKVVKLNKLQELKNLIKEYNLTAKQINSISDSNNNNEAKPLLHIAIENDSTNILKTLIKKGANPFLSVNNCSSALHFADKLGKAEIFEIILDVYVSQRKPIYEFIDFAVTNGLTNMVDALLKSKHSVTLVGKNDKILHKQYLPLAVKLKHMDLIDYLTKKINDFSSDIKKGNKLIHIAAVEKWEHIVEELLQKEPKLINAVNNFKQTPLHLIVENIIKRDEDLVIFKKLIQHGGELTTLKDSSNKTPIDLLLETKNSTLITGVVSELIHLHGNIDFRDNCLNSLLHYAVKNNYLDFAKFLITNGADCFLIDLDGYNILHLALIKSTEYAKEARAHDEELDQRILENYKEFALELIGSNDKPSLVREQERMRIREIHLYIWQQIRGL
jgi:ankyrin repeat protein